MVTALRQSDFLFIEEGKRYCCKIKLFGDFVPEPTDKSVPVKVQKTEVLIGNRNFIEVMIDSDLYYISKEDARDMILHETMHYDFTRKDLIQVDDVIHADYF